MKQINNLVEELSKQGRYGDTMLAHINPAEAEMLRSMGGSGTINPKTGLPEYWGWNPFRAVAEIFSPVLDPVSDFIGTGGGDQGILNKFDEGVQSVGSGFAELDDFVNEEIPGGWYTVGAVALGGAGLAGGLAGTAGLTAAEAAALAESAALADSAMVGAGGLGAGASAGLTAAEIAALAESSALADSAMIGAEGLTAGEVGGAISTPVLEPAMGQPYDVSPLTDPVTGQPFGSIEQPLTGNYMDGFTSVSETGLSTLPEEGMLPDLPGTTILGDLGLAGAVETAIPSSGISTMDVLRGVNLAKGLLGSSQEQAAAPATQFRGTRVPQGQVDYSGILSLLQMQSPQRRSLLG